MGMDRRDPRIAQKTGTTWGYGSYDSSTTATIGTGTPIGAQSQPNPTPTYQGAVGTPPPGSYYAGVDAPLEAGQTYGQLILPEGWAAIGGANDTGALTYIPWQNNPDGSWTEQTTAMVNAIKAGTYT